MKSRKVLPNGNVNSVATYRNFENKDIPLHSNVQMNELALASSDEKKKRPEQDEWSSLITQVKTFSKWLNYKSKRRQQYLIKSSSIQNKSKQNIPDEQFYNNLNATLNGIASECDDSSCDEDDHYKGRNKRMPTETLSKSSNKALILYFSKLARGKSNGDELDLDFIESLVNNGADINTADKYGQTVFHEVARTWHIDVAKFLLHLKADINQADKFGRTPLHVAAAVNYAEMVTFLMENGGLFLCHIFCFNPVSRSILKHCSC